MRFFKGLRHLFGGRANVGRPSAEDAARRLIILKRVVFHSIIAPPPEFWESLGRTLKEIDAKVQVEQFRRAWTFASTARP